MSELNRHRPLQGWLARHWEVGVLWLLTSVTYRPWSAAGLPILDFSEWLPLMAHAAGPWNQFVEVTAYLISLGRLCLMQSLFVVLNWNVFGTWAPGWHWAYFVINSASLLLARDVLLRFGLKRFPVILALALWAMMKTFAVAWTQPTGEGVGLLFILAGLRFAIGFSTTTQPGKRAIQIGICVVGMIYSKEMLVVLVPMIWLMSRVHIQQQVWSWSKWTARDMSLARMLLTTLVLALIPVAYIALHASSHSYAARYGSTPPDIGLIVRHIESALLPHSSVIPGLRQLINDPGWRLLVFLPNLVWIAVIADGAAAVTRRKWVCPFAFGLLWLAAGVIAYIPWPGPGKFYMLPFAFGSALLTAHGTTWLFERGKWIGTAGLTATFLIVPVTAFEAYDVMQHQQARVVLDSKIIASIGATVQMHRLVAAVSQPAAPGAWGFSRQLAEFGAVVKGVPPMSSQDVTCEAAKTIWKTEPYTVIVSEEKDCKEIVPGSEVVFATERPHQWPYRLSGEPIRQSAFIAGAGHRSRSHGQAGKTGPLSK